MKYKSKRFCFYLISGVFLAQTNLSLTSSNDNGFDDVGSSDKYNFKDLFIGIIAQDWLGKNFNCFNVI